MVFADTNILIMHYRNVVNFGVSLYLYPEFTIISTVHVVYDSICHSLIN